MFGWKRSSRGSWESCLRTDDFIHSTCIYRIPTVCQALVWDLGVYMLMAIEIQKKNKDSEWGVG